jgi:hypothetical protein
MSARVTFDGLDALLRDIANLPAALKTDARQIVTRRTEAAAEDVRRAYPEASRTPTGTGTLRNRVKTFYPSTTVIVGIVRSQAPHANIYEFGTHQRKTRAGWNRGTMPPHPDGDGVTPPIAQRHRRLMRRELIDMVRGHGFDVTEDNTGA